MTDEQFSFMVATALKPFVVLIALALLLCVRFAVIKWMPEGKLKRLFLIRVKKSAR